MAAASGTVRPRRCVVPPAGRHSASSLIFLHGSGGSGTGPRRCIKKVLNHDLTFQHIKVIYPTAPRRPSTPLKGGLSNVWFDRFKISNDCPERLESINVMCEVLTDVIDDEVKSVIEKNRILIGGFSTGGCMAMHLACRNHQDVAGVFALSGFLNKSSAVYQAATSRLSKTAEQTKTEDADIVTRHRSELEGTPVATAASVQKMPHLESDGRKRGLRGRGF